MGTLIITPKEKIDEYFESYALNQSSLKKLIGGIDFFINQSEEEKKLYYEEKGHFVIGSAVDTILTGEKGQFEKQYYVSMLDKKPSDTEMSIVNMVLADVVAIDPEAEIKTLSAYPGSIQKAIEEHNWQNNWKIDTRINKIIENCSVYFEDLKKGLGKQILSTAEKKLIDDIVFSLKSNKRTAGYFDRNLIEKGSSLMTFYYQLPIFFYYRGVYCKAMLDILIVIRDEKGRVIGVQPIDLKTMNGSTLRFPNTLKSFRYDIQAAWYREALLSKDSTLKLDLGGAEMQDVLLPFRFIVESNSYPGQPLIYQIDEEVLHVGKYGKKELKVKVAGNPYEELVKPSVKGFDELIDIYIYQTENDWQEEKVITDSDGVLKIGWNGIKE